MLARKARGLLRRASELAYVGQAGRAGLALRDHHAVRSHDTLRDLEHRFNLDVRTVLYIGANKGQDVALQLLTFPRAVVHCFEPQSGCQSALRDLASRWPGRVHVHPVALSNSTGTATLRRPAKHDMASSLMVPNAHMSELFPHVQDWEEEQVATDTLDAWAAGHSLGDDVLVKLDVQGAEPLVVAGGKRTFRQARFVVCELAVVTTYDAAPDMHTMFDVFHDLGFGYAGELEQVRDTEGLVVEFDGAFVRPQARAR